MIVSDKPGTTRDATDTLFKYQGRQFNLIDTAGIRRRGRIEKGLEKYSVIRSMQAMARADVGLLILDFQDGVTNQDCHVAEYLLEQIKGLIIVVNKIDLIKNEEAKKKFGSILRRKLIFLPWAPVVFVSALKKINIKQVLILAEQICEERKRRIEEEELSDWLLKVKYKHEIPGRKKRRLKIYSVKQVSNEPPEFIFRVNDPSLLHFSYRRYLENQLRKDFGFTGTAIKMIFARKKS